MHDTPPSSFVARCALLGRRSTGALAAASLGLMAALLPLSAQAGLQSYAGVYAGNEHPHPAGSALYLALLGPGVLRTDNTLADTGLLARSFTGLNPQGSLQTESFSGRAQAQADYGQLRLFASYSLTNRFGNLNVPAFVNPDFSINPEGLPTGFSAQSTIYVRDNLTVQSAQPVSFLQLSYRVQATVSETGGPAYDSWNNYLWFQAAGVDAKYYRGAVDEIHVVKLPVVDGTARLGLNLFAVAGLQSVFAPHYGLDVTGTVDAMNTVTLTSVQALGAEGQIVALNSVVGAEGFDYLQAAVVPEVPVWLLMLSSLPLLGLGLQRRAARP